MEQYILKSALVAEIERTKKNKEPKQDWHHDEFDDGYLSALDDVEKILNTLEVKEVDLDNITGWFDHIAQIADNRTTLTGQRMTDVHALDEIKCLAKNSSAFITKYYKAQKVE